MTDQQPDHYTKDIKSRSEEMGRAALPAGHPVSWQVLTEGTLLEGTDYPLPVFA